MNLFQATARLGLTCLIGVVLASPARADDVAAAEKLLTEALAKLKSVSYKVAVTQDLEMPGMTMKSSSTGTIEAVQQGKKWKQRLDMQTSGTTTMAGEETKTDSKILSIFDGEFSYMMTDSAGQKMAFKNKPEADTNMSPFDGKALFAAMREHYNIKRLPDASVLGRDCIVLEMTFKDPAAAAASPVAKSTTNICKKTGIQVKSEGFDAAGKLTQSSILSDIKVDEDVKPDRFEFKAPEGVNLVDTTKQP